MMGGQDSRLDGGESDYQGIPMSSTGRSQVMQRLAASHGVGDMAPAVGTMAPPPGGPPQQAKIGAPVTSQFMLTNMFDPAKETDPGWEQDIRDEVLEECSKYGAVVHINVDKLSKVMQPTCSSPSLVLALKSSKLQPT